MPFKYYLALLVNFEYLLSMSSIGSFGFFRDVNLEKLPLGRWNQFNWNGWTEVSTLLDINCSTPRNCIGLTYSTLKIYYIFFCNSFTKIPADNNKAERFLPNDIQHFAKFIKSFLIQTQHDQRWLKPGNRTFMNLDVIFRLAVLHWTL